MSETYIPFLLLKIKERYYQNDKVSQLSHCLIKEEKQVCTCGLIRDLNQLVSPYPQLIFEDYNKDSITTYSDLKYVETDDRLKSAFDGFLNAILGHSFEKIKDKHMKECKTVVESVFGVQK